MNVPSICEEPGCGGRVDPVTMKCQSCGVLYDDNPEARAFLEGTTNSGTTAKQASTQLVVAALSGLSRRDEVVEQPTVLADIALLDAGAERSDEGPDALALQAKLGGGVVEMPVVNPVDRLAQVDFQVRTPLGKRFCSNVRCEVPGAKPDASGRRPRPLLYWPKPNNLKKLPANCRLEEAEDSATGEKVTMFVPDKGFCRHCGTAFDFLPFAKGTRIDQYRIDGQFTFGGDGMLYHAVDTELNDTPIVIKASHNAGHVNLGRMASQEVSALLAVRGKPDTLQISGFKNFQGRLPIAMEWLNGDSLFGIVVNNRGPLPVAVGLSYLMGAIQSIKVGHDQSPALLHLDIKPNNFIVLAPGHHMKVIDYGGSQFEGKAVQDFVLTEGFSAPELYKDHPMNVGKKPRATKAADVFSLGRLFCFLSLSFTLTGKHAFSLPPPSLVPQFAEFESLYRLIRRMTAVNPAERMTLSEAYDAVAAVRNEVVALRERRSLPSVSTVFLPDTTKEIELTYANLPVLALDNTDQAIHMIAEALGTADPNRQRALLEEACIQFPKSKEAKLRLAALDIDSGKLASARRTLEQYAKSNPFDCRAVYQLGRLALAEGDVERAARCFDACYSVWPGEMAIKLPNGLCAELLGNHARASRLFETAAWVNPDYTAGPFGWARVASKAQDWAAAIEAYNRVPRTSWAYRLAVMGRVQALVKRIGSATASGIGLVELQQAADAASFVVSDGDSFEGFQAKAEVLKMAIQLLDARSLKPDAKVLLLGVPFVSRNLKAAAAKALLDCARLAVDPSVKVKFVDESRSVGGARFI
jgi:serine/threonine-protein kinase PknG